MALEMPMFNRKYIFIHGGIFQPAMVVFGGGVMNLKHTFQGVSKICCLKYSWSVTGSSCSDVVTSSAGRFNQFSNDLNKFSNVPGGYLNFVHLLYDLFRLSLKILSLQPPMFSGLALLLSTEAFMDSHDFHWQGYLTPKTPPKKKLWKNGHPRKIAGGVRVQ